MLSNGVINLILLLKTNCTIDSSMMGRNCWPILQEIANKKDIRICVYGPIEFQDPIDVYFEDTRLRTTSVKEYGFELLDLLQKNWDDPND